MKETIKEERLDKFLANQGIGTRSEVKKYIRQGEVFVNGAAVKTPEYKIDPQTDEVSCRGMRVIKSGPSYYLFYKPAGCVTATEDDYSRTVMDYLDVPKKEDLFPVGRLDKDTEGLLLITDDGALAHKLLSPKKHVDKTYFALVSGEVTGEDIEAFASGLDIQDEKETMPAKLKVLGIQRREECVYSEVEVTIQEGRYHQVKRMFEAVGKKVTYLKRLSMGTLTLTPELEKGCYRPLTDEEIKELRACI